MPLALYLLACVGVVEIVSTGLIFRRMREAVTKHAPRFGALLSCPMCLGWWVGGMLACAVATRGRPAGQWLASIGSHGLDEFARAGAASAVCWGAHVVLVRLGSREL